VTGVNHW